MQGEDRRGFLKAGGAHLAVGVVGGLGASARAAEHKDQMEQGIKSEKGVDAFTVKAREEGICATCQFWGGVRRVSEDRQTVYCETLGWCNNPKSRYFQTKTTPATGPMGSWKRWDALSM